MEKQVGLHGLVPLKRFFTVTGMETLEFKKGKGRQFVSTPVGVVFMSAKFDKTQPGYITVAGETIKSAKGESLEGSLWLVNSVITDGDVITA